MEKLTKYRVSDKIRYHVSRMAEDAICYEYNGAACFDVKTPHIGAARAVWYDIAALSASIRWCQNHPGIKQPVFYILACRIGPFIGFFKRRIRALDGFLYINPDGHEWKRRRWNRLIRGYWKLSERLMVKHADFVICDSIQIQKYIEKEYAAYHPMTAFIAYGSDSHPSVLEDDKGSFADWLSEKGLKAGQYYLAVSRFVPENNFETMIREFMQSGSARDLAIITTKNAKFYAALEKKLHFSGDSRIKFVGTVYDTELLKKIRENAYAYFHGHEVGGTNPSLLEALGSTNLNLLLDVSFNREVAQKAALYWTKKKGSLSALIARAEAMSAGEIAKMGQLAKKQIAERYRWEDIAEKYERQFLNSGMGSICG